MPHRLSQLALPLLATAGAMAAFQVGAGLAKGLFSTVGPVGAAALRLFIGGVILVAITRPWLSWSRSTSIGPIVVLGIGMSATIVLFYLAIERIPLGIAIAIQFLGPLTVAVLHSRRLGDMPWALLAGLGVWCLVGVGSSEYRLDPWGVLFALGGAAGWGTYIVLGRIVGISFGRSAAGLTLTLAGLVLLPVALAQSGMRLFSPELLPLAVLVALFSGAVPFSLELYALTRLPARTFAVFTSLEPAFAALAGLLILNEVLIPSQLLGVALVIVAAAGAAWRGAKTLDSKA